MDIYLVIFLLRYIKGFQRCQSNELYFKNKVGEEQWKIILLLFVICVNSI